MLGKFWGNDADSTREEDNFMTKMRTNEAVVSQNKSMARKNKRAGSLFRAHLPCEMAACPVMRLAIDELC
jgi:hypothetical protein